MVTTSDLSPTKMTAIQLYKHLVLYNKGAREEYLVKGLAKMKKEQLLKEFNKRFVLEGSPVTSNAQWFYPIDKNWKGNVKDFEKIFPPDVIRRAPKKKMEKPEPKKKIIKLKLKKKKN